MARVRRPAVVGRFYPGAPRALEDAVRGYLRAAEAPDEPAPKALIAPHAGYVYSGPVAASAYARIAPRAAEIRRVVLLGPAHLVYVRGLAAPVAESFETPLGAVPVDRAALESVLELPHVGASDVPHAREHSIEVHLPFLQVLLGAASGAQRAGGERRPEGFAIAPLVVGDAEPEAVQEVLDLLWSGDDTLVVVSSDLSHYHDYATARRIDAVTVRAIEAREGERIDAEHACGYLPVRGLLRCARERDLRVRAVDVRNSGDTAGSRESVVGYGSFLVG